MRRTEASDLWQGSPPHLLPEACTTGPIFQAAPNLLHTQNPQALGGPLCVLGCWETGSGMTLPPLPLLPLSCPSPPPANYILLQPGAGRGRGGEVVPSSPPESGSAGPEGCSSRGGIRSPQADSRANLSSLWAVALSQMGDSTGPALRPALRFPPDARHSMALWALKAGGAGGVGTGGGEPSPHLG